MKMSRPTSKRKNTSSLMVQALVSVTVIAALVLICSSLVVLHHQESRSLATLDFLTSTGHNSTTITLQQKDPCDDEYHRIVSHITSGLTPDDYVRSQAYPGNRYRLGRFIEKLQQRPIHAVVCGGSISLGHGVTPESMRYSNQLEVWLNTMYPIPNTQQKHKVWNKGSHGADMCAMAKRIHLIGLEKDIKPDLIVLEFSVNDYQGQVGCSSRVAIAMS